MTNEEKELHFNEDHFKLLLSRLQRDVEKISVGGGSAKAEAQRAQGKMTARDRITYLLDKGQIHLR